MALTNHLPRTTRAPAKLIPANSRGLASSKFTNHARYSRKPGLAQAVAMNHTITIMALTAITVDLPATRPIPLPWGLRREGVKGGGMGLR